MERAVTRRAKARMVAAAAVLAGVLAAPAMAGAPKERFYDDSFGNLIILSPAGYKRIVVGMGHVAAELEAEQRAFAAEPDHRPVRAVHCHAEPVLWKGRSYMYGLADGEIPSPPLVCN